MASEPGTLNFPTTLDDVITLVQANNHASATLTASITNSQLTIPVSQISEFSASGYATILDSLVNPTTIEIVKYTSKSGSDLVIPAGGRGQQGTSASAFSSAAPIEQRPTARHHTVLADLLLLIENKIGYGTPLRPLDTSGTNQAGNHIEVTGGKGTGTGIPGFFAQRYPLKTASGTSVHADSANRYPVPSNMFTSGSGQTVANTVTETTLLDAGSPGSVKTIEANMARPGQLFRVVSNVFQLGTTGTPTGRVRVKIGAVTIVDTTAVAFPTAALNSSGRIVVDLWVTAVGATGSVTATVIFEYADSTTGAGEANKRCMFGRGAASGTIDFTAAQAIDLTWQWGTASASNSIVVGPSSIDIIR